MPCAKQDTPKQPTQCCRHSQGPEQVLRCPLWQVALDDQRSIIDPLLLGPKLEARETTMAWLADLIHMSAGMFATTISKSYSIKAMHADVTHFGLIAWTKPSEKH